MKLTLLEKVIREYFKETGTIIVPKNMTDYEHIAFMEAGMAAFQSIKDDKVVKQPQVSDYDKALEESEAEAVEAAADDTYIGGVPRTMADGCACGRPFYACECGAAVDQERREG